MSGSMLRRSILTALPLMVTASALAQTIPFKVARNKTILPVRVGSSPELRIILDSGMGFDGLLLYNPALNENMTLPQAMNVQIPGAGNGPPSEGLMTNSGSFALGPVELSDQRILLLQSSTYAGFPSDGVIGYSLLGHHRVMLDYDKNRMILDPAWQPDSSWTQVPLYFKSNHIPWMDIQLSTAGEAPVTVSVYIDLASGEAIELLERPEMKYDLPSEKKKAYLGRGLSGDIHGHRGEVAAIIIGGHRLTDVRAAMAPAAVRSKQPDADAIIGNDFLRRFNLIFDYESRSLYIRPNSHFDEDWQSSGI